MPHPTPRILACVDSSPEGLRLARASADLARQLHARLVALWGLRRPSPSPAETFARGSGPMHEVFAHEVAASAELTARARRECELATGSAGVAVEFRPVPDDAASPLPPAEAGDLFVVGDPRLPDQPEALSGERLLIGSGRPVLILPAGASLDLDRPVLIGWNGSPAARRAAEDALPLIRHAGSATILVVDEAASPESAQDLAENLTERGVLPTVRAVESGSATVAETIAAVAVELGAGLIVLGGYSRSPTLERIFGGVSRTFLAGASGPLLLSHVPGRVARGEASEHATA